MAKIRNLTISEFRAFLKDCGLHKSHTTGGHEIWTRDGLTRPVTFQTHIEPIPEFIVRNNLNVIGATRKDLTDFLSRK